LTTEARRRLIGFANGDARAALNALEFVVAQTPPNEQGRLCLDDRALEVALTSKMLRYDRAGEEHYNLISAFIKSLRDSDPDAALYWLARMLEGGEDPKFIARRLVIFASEDIGNAEPSALLIATAVFHAVECVGLPEARINLAQGTTYLASSRKDNASYVGLLEATRDAREFGNLAVPLHLRNAVTSLLGFQVLLGMQARTNPVDVVQNGRDRAPLLGLSVDQRGPGQPDTERPATIISRSR